MTQDLKIIIIAGPNGAGKTTFAREFLPHEANCPVFVNVKHIPHPPPSLPLEGGGASLPPLQGEGWGGDGGQWGMFHDAGWRFAMPVNADLIAAGLAPFAPLVDSWVLYNNSGEEPVSLDWSEKS